MDAIDTVFLIVRLPVFVVAAAVVVPFYALLIVLSALIAVVITPFIIIYAALQNDRDLIQSYAFQPLSNVLKSTRSSFTILLDWLLGKDGPSKYSHSGEQPNPLAAIGGMLAILAYFAFPVFQYQFGQKTTTFSGHQVGYAEWLYVTLGSAIAALLVAALPVVKSRRPFIILASLREEVDLSDSTSGYKGALCRQPLRSSRWG